jgi:DNA mismatch repair protein MutS
MIQFAYEHNPMLIKRLQIPKCLLQENRLVLEYNTSLQLNIIGSGMLNELPLVTILNRTVTSLGSRLYRERLLNPIVNTYLLEQRYSEIAMYSKDDLYKQIRKQLSGILDLERILRRMVAESYNPCDWPSFHSSLTSAGLITHILLIKSSNLIWM